MKRTLLIVLAAFAPAQEPWLLVQLPDTQHYGDHPNRYGHWVGMCWTIRNWVWRPVYVGHVGDFTQDATDEQFARGRDAMALLGDLPWGASMGNHDFDGGRKCTRSGGPCTVQWARWLGPSNFARRVQTPSGPLTFLHLEWLPSDAAIAAARAVMDADPTTPVILVTHYWLDSGGAPLSRAGTDLDTDGDNGPHALWRKLVDLYPQVWAVWCGHVHDVVYRATTSAFGTHVLSFLFNTQNDPEGGQGFMRLYGVFGDHLWIASLSATWRGLLPDRHEAWSLPYPFTAHRASLTRPILRLAPAADTFVRTHYGGGATFGSADLLYAETAVDRQVALVRFDLRGVPSVERAILSLTFEGHAADGDGFTVHRMLRPWTEGDSWASLGGLVAGRDYVAAPDLVVGPHGFDTLNLDATALTRASLAQPNHGWAFVGLGNSSGFRSREWRGVPERPLLSVRLH